jgi:hypothetical protein
MDPKACLRLVSDALKDRDFETAAEHLEDYRAWRSRGGYEPCLDDARPYASRGDDLARHYRHACMLHGFGGK